MKGLGLCGLWLFVLFAASRAGAADARWLDDPYLGLRVARHDQRPLIVLFTSERCYYCQQLKQQTLTSPKVQAQLANSYVPVELNARKHAALAQRLGVHRYPTLLVISPQNRLVTRVEGFVSADKLADTLLGAAQAVRLAAGRATSADRP